MRHMSQTYRESLVLTDDLDKEKGEWLRHFSGAFLGVKEWYTGHIVHSHCEEPLRII